MAYFANGETPTEDPFTKYLSPLQVAQSIQTVIDASWHNLPRSERTSGALNQSVYNEFVRIESWWMALPDRTAHKILEASQTAFSMPESVRDAAKRGNLTHEEMFRWIPASELASAIFWAWLLQPKESRDHVRTVALVRTIIDRELRSAAEDLCAFV